jgi:hypothetical protein
VRLTATKGHLQHGALHLKQTDKVRQELSKATTTHYALKKIKVDLGWQGQSEYAAGYASGLAGEPEPRREKGQSFYGGWLAGKADREAL